MIYDKLYYCGHTTASMHSGWMQFCPGTFLLTGLIQRTITRGAMIQLNEDCCQPLQFHIFRFSATGTLTTRTPPPARRGSWPRAPDSPPPRSRTGSRTGGSGTGRLRDPGKIFLLLFFYDPGEDLFCVIVLMTVTIRNLKSQ